MKTPAYLNETRTFEDRTRPCTPSALGCPILPLNHGLVLESARPGEAVQGRVCVKNTGTRDGKEVGQVYISHQNASVSTPKYQLAHLGRILLKAGEEKTYSFVLRPVPWR